MGKKLPNTLLTTLMGAALLGGCSLAPPMEPVAGVVPAALPADGVYPAATEGSAADIAWRDFFLDDRLKSVITTGLENNRDLRASVANVLAARARYRVQRADRLPTIGASGSATFTDDIAQAAALGQQGGGNVEFYSAQIGISAFEIDLFGRVRNLSEAALQTYFATEEAQRAARISLIAEIANAWLSYGAAQDQLRIAEKTLVTYQETRDLTQAQFRIGVASELEASQAEAQYQAARTDIATLRTQLAQTRNALELLAGAPVTDALLPQGLPDDGATLKSLPTGLSSSVLLRRPDVLGAERQLRAQNANIGAARAALFPTISLTATYGTASTALSGLFGSGTFAYNVSPGISLPIFDMGRRQANVRAAQADQQAALAAYEGAIQSAFREVSDALAQRGTIGEQVDGQARRAEAARKAATLSEARYRVGVSSFLQVLDAQRTAYAADQLLVQTRLAEQTNGIELYRSLGGGLS
ncbi:MAG: transporter [Sphingomonas sp.]|nr:MAG: transporter [Sphingomonas sp.]